MTTSRAAKIFAISAGAGVLAAPLAFASTAAFAAADCGTGTEVSAGICEQAFTTAGDSTFTAPSGVTKVSAIIVGAGGGAEYNSDGAYGGGGGEVLFVDNISTTSPVNLTVGAGGAADPGTDGEADRGGASAYGSDGAYGGGGGEVVFVDSVDASSPVELTVGEGGGISADFGDASAGGDSSFGSTVAVGGTGGTFTGGGTSGNGNEGSHVDPDLGAGGGAGDATTDCVSGAGLTASEVALGSSLFPATSGEAIFGAGGSCDAITLGSFTGTAGSGGSVSGDFGAATADVGEDGAVIIRWGALPDTGMSVQPWMIGAGVATVAAGALFASGVLRTRRQGRHSA